jgi:hypothetical protein
MDLPQDCVGVTLLNCLFVCHSVSKSGCTFCVLCDIVIPLLDLLHL